MTSSSTTSLPSFPFAQPSGNPFQPMSDADRHGLIGPPTIVRLPTGAQAWLVTRHADVRQMLRHPDLSADASRPGFPLLRPLPPQSEQDRAGGFLRMDGEEHSRLRRMLTAEFMVKNIRRIEPLIQQTVDQALDDMTAAGPPADLVASFALPVPSAVICHLLGVPYADHAFFQSHSRELLDLTTSLDRVPVVVEELRGYLRSLIEAKRGRISTERGRTGTDADGGAKVGDDLLSRLIVERVETGELAPEELVGMALLLLIAGHETTANMISLSVLLLLQHPEHLAALRADPALAPHLVEELLRYLTIVRTGLARVAAADVTIGGQLIRAGEGVIALLPLANRDDALFGDPDRFDPYRAAHQHVAFGFGVHQCIGQPLARAELRIALTALARRLPHLAASVSPEKAATRDRSVVHGLAELPVTW